jgi:hypothetical protein
MSEIEIYAMHTGKHFPFPCNLLHLKLFPIKRGVYFFCSKKIAKYSFDKFN